MAMSMRRHEPLPDHGDAHDRQRALAERPCQRHRDSQFHVSRGTAHQENRDAERSGDGAEDHPAAESIDETADTDRARGADERRPQVQLCVIDAADLEIGEQRLGDEAETLGAAGERADHRGRRHEQHNPAVIRRTVASCVVRGGGASCRWASDLMGIAMPSAEKRFAAVFTNSCLIEVLVDELLRAKNHGEADAGIAECVEPHERLEARHAALAPCA